ncbi:MAG: glycosyltransferase family 4 protein [Verrucomicrobia bacterium]|nr:glycosyltransferase family 4 protein [Verrucomicrobiota bacterium]
MRIALLVRRFITTGGAERYAVEVARRLARAHQVHVFAQQWDHESTGLTLHRVSRPFRKPAYADRWWFSRQTARLTRGFDVVYSHEKVTRFDVMNVHCGTFIGGLRGVERGEPRNPAAIWLKTLTDPSIGANWLLERIHYTTAPGRFWVADSDLVKREVQRYYPIPDDRFLVAHSGVDDPAPNLAERRLEWRRKLGFRDADVVALFVASEFRRKGLGPLLEALGRLRDRGPRLVIVGGDDRAPYAARAGELGVADRITWAGRVNNVTDYYALSDVLVLPTLSDPSPLAPLEAMAHGCAALISSARYTGAAELVQPDEAILLEDPRNPAEIAAALTRLLDTATRKTYAEKGRQRVRGLSWERTAAVVSAALEKSWTERHRP